ncbi:MAG: ferritin family protein [Deltaproteobacteria bacterium]|nr:ferritin family protein [Deltaproteobacteria bacterium]
MFYSVDEIFAMAEQIERNGARFYRRGAELAKTDEARRLLLDLAAWEAGHESIFGRLRAALPDSVAQAFDPDGEAELYLAAVAGQHVFATDEGPDLVLAGAHTTRDILERALKFELDSILFFVGMKKAVPTGDSGREVEQLIDEEFGHVAYLEKALASLGA